MIDGRAGGAVLKMASEGFAAHWRIAGVAGVPTTRVISETCDPRFARRTVIVVCGPMSDHLLFANGQMADAAFFFAVLHDLATANCQLALVALGRGMGFLVHRPFLADGALVMGANQMAADAAGHLATNATVGLFFVLCRTRCGLAVIASF